MIKIKASVLNNAPNITVGALEYSWFELQYTDNSVLTLFEIKHW